jgi:hypothetical protein
MTRSRHLLTATFLAALALLSVFGVVHLLSQSPGQVSSQSASSEEKLAEKIEHYRQVSQTPTMDPTAIAAKVAEFDRQMAAQAQSYREWLEGFKASGVDPATLRRTDMGGLYASGPKTIDEAVSSAVLIVKGLVTDVEFRADHPMPQAFVSFEVKEVLKGQAGPTLNLVFGGGPLPAAHSGAYKDAALGQWDVEPLILPGDEVVLLLKPYSGNESGYAALAWSGVNRLEKGRVAASVADESETHSTAKTLFYGWTESELIRLLKEAVARNP